MNEWKDPSKELPIEGERVEVRLISGQRIKPVEFFVGRFWKYRKGTGGHIYDVDAWRSIAEKKGGRQIHARAIDSFTTSAENSD